MQVAIIRLVYFLAFDLLCLFSKIFTIDPSSQNTYGKINEILANQQTIEKHLKDIYKNEKGGDLKAEKTPHNK